MAFDPASTTRTLHARIQRTAWLRSTGSRAAAGLRYAIAALALAAMTGGAGVSPASAGDPFTSSYPHLFYDDTGWLDGQLEVIAHFDVLTTAFWNGEGERAARLDSLRLMNPDLVRLAYFNLAGKSLPEVVDPDHVVNRLGRGIADEWLARNEHGELIYWDPRAPNAVLLNVSTKCPRVNGKTWGEFAADFMIDEVLPAGRWEGLMMDNVWSGASWMNASIPGSLDLDLNGVPDHPDSADAWWTAGLNLMLERFHARVGPNVIAIGNGNGRHFSLLNGRYFEDFPNREGWSGSLIQAADWQAHGQNPVLLAGVTRSTEGDFKLMRYGLTTALMGGIFSFHYAGEHSWPNPVLYDEYLVDLGQPIGPPRELGIDIIGTADFETGLPASFPGACSGGQAVWTTNPQYVVEGNASLLGLFGNDPGVWHLFLCSDPSELALTPNATYTLSFKYRVVSEPPGNGYFYVGARSNVNQTASNRNLLIIDPPVGTVGEARGDVTLGPYSGYYLYFGMLNGGSIVIDSIQIVSGRGGIFRRDFENGVALVNPTTGPMSVTLESGLYRIDGTVDPQTNNGEATSFVVLPGADGLVLMRGPAGVEHPGSPETPRAPGLVYGYPNPALVADHQSVSIAGVPTGGSVTIVAPTGRILRRITRPDATGTWAWDFRTAQGRTVPAGIYMAAVRDATNRMIGTTRLAIGH